jgi:hypothetical protein
MGNITELLEEKLTKKQIERLCDDDNLRKVIISDTVGLFLDFGFIIDVVNWDVNASDSRELFSVKNLQLLTKLMQFLNRIHMKRLSALLFLGLCKTMKNNQDFEVYVRKLDLLDVWLSTQDYIAPRCIVDALNYIGNSCYQDTVFFALFALKTKLIEDSLIFKKVEEKYLPLQKEMQKIYNTFRGQKQVTTCSDFRAVLSQYNPSQEFHKPIPQDAGEFLSFLFTIFQFDIMTKKRRTYVGNDGPLIKVSETKYKDTPIIPVLLYQPGRYDLTDFLNHRDEAILDASNLYKINGSTYSRRVEKTSIKASDMAIFYVQRLTDVEISIPDSIEINKVLSLYCIITLSRGHYTAFIKCGNLWYHYDDNPGGEKYKLVLVDYNTVLEVGKRKGMLFFYI